MRYENSLAFARKQDLQDSLSIFRDQFHQPLRNGEPVLYFSGHSLGLQPKSARHALDVEFSDWAQLAVDGHFIGTNPWYGYHELLTPATARLVGAKESEVVSMNSLTTNLHLLFVSFYRPSSRRYKIICEAGMFPSDRYLLETQVRFHGFDPDDAIVEVDPRPGEHIIREEDIFSVIDEISDEIAMVYFGGVNYFTGQFFDIRALSSAAHSVGAVAGFDLAHAAGNLPMELHDWGVDFAAWCTYKYMNSGPGSVASIFVHERHGKNFDLPRFGGWWGHDKERRFLMENRFSPMPGAEGWQISNAPVIGMSLLKASLDIFDDAGIDNMREKSVRLTGYLEYVFDELANQFPEYGIQIITPAVPDQRGCQLSIKVNGSARKLFDTLTQAGAITDFREPDVIRMAPVPLYNSFEDVYRFGAKLQGILQSWVT